MLAAPRGDVNFGEGANLTTHSLLQRALQLLFREKWFGKADGDAEVRAAEAFQDGVCDADHFALPIEEWSAGAAGGGLRVKHDFISEDIADVALRDERANQVSPREFIENLRHVAAAVRENLLRRILIRARENRGESRRVT